MFLISTGGIFLSIFETLLLSFMRFSSGKSGVMLMCFPNLSYKRFSVLVAKNSLKQGWFRHPYCGVALGFPKDHLASEAFVRCLLCRRDVKVFSRGISTFAEHCRTGRHHRLDCLYRMRKGLQMRARSGSLMDEDEAEQMRESLGALVVPAFERCPDYTVDEVLSLESRGTTVWAVLSAEQEQKMNSAQVLLTMLLDAIHRDGDIESVAGLWSSLCVADRHHFQLLGSTCSVADIAVRFVFLTNFRCFRRM